MQRIVLMLILVLASFSSFAQFKVGRSKEEIKADKDKATPKLIGAKYTALTIDYGLYAVGDSTEFLKYITKGALNSEIHETITFTSLQEESDFYHYILDLFDDFKDNEIILNENRIVPHPMKLLGINNIMFDVYPRGNSDYKNETIMFSKKGWVRLFQKSKIHAK